MGRHDDVAEKVSDLYDTRKNHAYETLPAYALDATSRMMGYAMGGSSEKLPRVG